MVLQPDWYGITGTISHPLSDEIFLYNGWCLVGFICQYAFYHYPKETARVMSQRIFWNGFLELKKV